MRVKRRPATADDGGAGARPLVRRIREVSGPVEGLVFAAMGGSALLAAAVGVRLLVLRSTRGEPLRLLGAGLLFGCGVNHALMLLLALVPAGAPLRRALVVGAILCTGSGATAMSRFNHAVYHPKSALLHAVTAMIATYFAVQAGARLLSLELQGPLSGNVVFAVLLAVYGWSAWEAFGCYAAYRRAPGLDPLVVQRFLVWGLGGLCAVGWVLSVWLGGSHLLARGLGAVFAPLLAVAVLFAFAPPRWYRRRLRAAAAGAPA